MKIRLTYAEGATPLDPDEAQGLKHKHITTMEELNVLEQANIEDGLLWISRMRRREVLNDDFVCELHKRLFGEVWTWAGEYRTTQKNIGIDPAQIPIEVRNLMDDARYWKEHGIYRPIIGAVILHHRLVKIHPFANGNGRHGRIMADAVLEKLYDLPPINWTADQDLQQNESARRKAYIAALKAADNHDYGPLFSFIGEAP